MQLPATKSYLSVFIYLVSLINFASSAFFDTLSSYTYCQFTECCNDDYINSDLNALKYTLQNTLYGQHIVQKELFFALLAHFQNTNNKHRKPLVLSFHGTPGTGKSMVANAIVEAIYKKGAQSKYVQIYNGRAAFPLESETANYNRKINEDIKNAVSKCARSLFIFNEVHKMPAGIFESLSSWVDYNYFGVDVAQSVFILISNTAGVEISDHLGHLMKLGVQREETQLIDFEGIIRRASYNVEGGLKKSELIKSHVVDHFIPFLPLEISHVRKCIQDEAARWNRRSNELLEDEIIRSSVSLDSTHDLFSVFGCKGLEKDVALAVKKTENSLTSRNEL